MKNEMRPNYIQSKNCDYSFTPSITTIAFPLLFGRKKENPPTQEKTPKTKPKSKPKGLVVDKYELVESTVKFFAAKGFPKKHWVVLKEIPVQEITGIESSGNDLSVTWNGVVYFFVLRKKSESFVSVRDQIHGLMVDQSKSVQSSESTDEIKSELTKIINASISVVDLSFNILMGLQVKRVIWARLESFADSLGSNLNFNGQIIAPLNLDFGNLSNAIKRQVPKETSKEAYGILKSIYEYFDGLKPQDDQKDTALNFQNAKVAVLAYYTLNDLMFAKVVGEKDYETESLVLESLLLGLANESNVKVSFGELKANIDSFDGQVEIGRVVENTRASFRIQLKLL
jgi:hypothetical protein